ncbi:hypothetical protein PINS_up014408 [Pythium insidiosum]|nr:hypothetical protein PINS_up014408 [Pythium insidiosum]
MTEKLSTLCPNQSETVGAFPLLLIWISKCRLQWPSDNKVVGLVTCGGTCEPEDAAEDITLIIADLERQGIHIPDAY